MNVIIIGCGPAGLAAAHAAVTLGANITVYAPKQQTPQRGPITLHRAIPGINNGEPEGYVRQIVIGGSILDYRLKLYGDVNIAINGDILEHGFVTWRVPETYDALWKLYSGAVFDAEIAADELSEIPAACDLVVNTAPRHEFCLKPETHEFFSKHIALTPHASYPGQPPNTVIYNAYPDIKWVRSSRIFEAEVTEWEVGDAPNDALVIAKPISTTCDCHPRVFRTGRHGTHHNETWIDHAYFDTYRVIRSMMHKKEWEAVK